MNTRGRQIGIPVAVVALLLLGGGSTRKYVPRANEELNATWIQENNDHRAQKEIIGPDGRFETYWKLSDPNPAWEGTFEIVKRWTDRKGNAWYRVQGTVTGCRGQAKSYGIPCPGVGSKWHELFRITKSGTALEVNRRPVMELSSKVFPTRIDPNPKVGVYESLTRADK